MLACFREGEDAWSISVALSGLVQVALTRGDTEEATRLIGEYEAVSSAAGDWAHLALSLNLQASGGRGCAAQGRVVNKV